MDGIRYRRVVGNPPEWLVSDAPMRCPYLPHQTARLPLRLPVRPLRPEEFAQRLEAGDRRQGVLLYRPSCPTCNACEAIRIDVDTFMPSKTQRRIFRHGEAAFDTSVGRPTPTAEKVALYNQHKLERDLLVNRELVDAAAYEEFLVETCTDTVELSYRHAGKLVGVAVADRARNALSAVYCFYDPAYGRLSPGTYSILKQIALCRTWGLRYLYLGLYIADCRSMRYKARYLPHERLIEGEWRRFEGRDRVGAQAGSRL
ncbi:MAG TPA: arginyltransferase [Candidatus Margulisiibacteriota bacterium]|nr:arginyltransferase [Candidatus Margulisiibacteriota bacterium]